MTTLTAISNHAATAARIAEDWRISEERNALRIATIKHETGARRVTFETDLVEARAQAVVQFKRSDAEEYIDPANELADPNYRAQIALKAAEVVAGHREMLKRLDKSHTPALEAHAAAAAAWIVVGKRARAYPMAEVLKWVKQANGKTQGIVEQVRRERKAQRRAERAAAA